MNVIRISILVGTLTGGVSCFAASNDIERAILSFPQISAAAYRPDVAVECANALISAGKDNACAMLAETVRARRDLTDFDQAKLEERDRINQKVCLLCRLLFMPTNSGEPLRAPRLGFPQGIPIYSMRPVDWPDMPFAIVDNVPLSLNLGFAIGGLPELAENYLAYCTENGKFRTRPFPKATFLTASNALNQVFSSPAWKSLKWKDGGVGWEYDLNEDDTKKGLLTQVENMTKVPAPKK